MEIIRLQGSDSVEAEVVGIYTWNGKVYGTAIIAGVGVAVMKGENGNWYLDI